jgi:hypothetical protein
MTPLCGPPSPSPSLPPAPNLCNLTSLSHPTSSPYPPPLPPPQDASLKSQGVSHGDMIFLLYSGERQVAPVVKVSEGVWLEGAGVPVGTCATSAEKPIENAHADMHACECSHSHLRHEPSLAPCGDDDIYDLRKGSDRASLAWRHGSMKDNTR